MEIKMIDLDKTGTTVSHAETATVSQPQIKRNMPQPTKNNLAPLVIAFVIFSIGGFYSGAWLKTSGKKVAGTSAGLGNIQADVPSQGVKVGDIFGSADEKAFNTTATGVLDKGGLNGEGTHKLVRPGGVSQTVYLTSSVVDLDTLVGDQVTIWGETFKGQKTGWLMDVGRVKVENLNVPLPK